MAAQLSNAMADFLKEAARIRKDAEQSPFWNLNIDALLESNQECFEGPLSKSDIEDCFNFVLDQYDPNVLIKEGLLKPEEYEGYLKNNEDGNPFFSTIELDEQRQVKDVILYETIDLELVADFLSKKYKWKDGA